MSRRREFVPEPNHYRPTYELAALGHHGQFAKANFPLSDYFPSNNQAVNDDTYLTKKVG
jgi:hypothetical protein